jgi:hypothetical protein
MSSPDVGVLRGFSAVAINTNSLFDLLLRRVFEASHPRETGIAFQRQRLAIPFACQPDFPRRLCVVPAQALEAESRADAIYIPIEKMY